MLIRSLRADREHLIHPLSHPTDHTQPLVIVRGEGQVIDARGNLLFRRALWPVERERRPRPGPRKLAQVSAEQMSTLAFNTNNYVGFANIPSAELADKLVSLAYPNLNAVYFTTAGAEINESAFKTARFFWKPSRQTRQGQSHLASLGLPRRDHGP